MAGIEEKAVITIATRTPTPIFVGLGIIVIWFIIFILAINAMECTQTYQAWYSLFHLVDKCTFGQRDLDSGVVSSIAAVFSLIIETPTATASSPM
jgi:hypothetical protein